MAFYEAPSDSRILYKQPLGTGIYLRSDDAGRSWTRPKHLIGGMSRRVFAERIGKRTQSTVSFTIVAVHPAQPRTAFATLLIEPVGQVQPAKGQKAFQNLGDLYVTRDGCETWTLFAEGMGEAAALGIAPSNPRVMFAVGSEGVVKSTNGGKTWVPVGQQKELSAPPYIPGRAERQAKLFPGIRFGPVPVEIYRIVVDLRDEDVVYIVSNKGLYRTLDSARTWCLLNTGPDILDNVNSLGLNPADPQELFVGTRLGTLYSKDRGCHFERIYPPLRPKDSPTGPQE